MHRRSLPHLSLTSAAPYPSTNPENLLPYGKTGIGSGNSTEFRGLRSVNPCGAPVGLLMAKNQQRELPPQAPTSLDLAPAMSTVQPRQPSAGMHATRPAAEARRHAEPHRLLGNHAASARAGTEPEQRSQGCTWSAKSTAPAFAEKSEASARRSPGFAGTRETATRPKAAGRHCGTVGGMPRQSDQQPPSEQQRGPDQPGKHRHRTSGCRRQESCKRRRTDPQPPAGRVNHDHADAAAPDAAQKTWPAQREAYRETTDPSAWGGSGNKLPGKDILPPSR